MTQRLDTNYCSGSSYISSTVNNCEAILEKWEGKEGTGFRTVINIARPGIKKFKGPYKKGKATDFRRAYEFAAKNNLSLGAAAEAMSFNPNSVYSYAKRRNLPHIKGTLKIEN